MARVTKAELRKPLTFSAWHRKRMGASPNYACAEFGCRHRYATYLLSLKSLKSVMP